MFSFTQVFSCFLNFHASPILVFKWFGREFQDSAPLYLILFFARLVSLSGILRFPKAIVLVLFLYWGLNSVFRYTGLLSWCCMSFQYYWKIEPLHIREDEWRDIQIPKICTLGSNKFSRDSLPPFYISFFTVFSQIHSKKERVQSM